MLPPSQTFPVVTFLGIVVQLAGTLLLVVLFVLLRRYTLRRGYFTAWVEAWAAFAIAIAALVFRYTILPAVVPELDMPAWGDWILHFAYQGAKTIGFLSFLRGTAMYVGGGRARELTHPAVFVIALAYAALSTAVSDRGLNELVVWQSVIAVPMLGYCASALLWLPASRRTLGTVATGTGFGLLALLWLAYAGAFGMALTAGDSALRPVAMNFINFNSYADLLINIHLGYGMVVLLMEDAKREVNDAHQELRIAHDQFRRAALGDPLTGALNRHAFAEGVGLEMARATFGTAVMVDVDNLKYVNDRYGHAVGDALLTRSVDVLRHALRPYDKIYRWGGDEFLMIMPSARTTDVIDRLQAAIDGAQALVVLDETIPLEVSFGTADYTSGERLPAAINAADRAMYEEKNRRKAARARALVDGGPDRTARPAPVPPISTSG